MSMLSQYMEKERLLKQLQEELQALESNKEMTKELEFKHALEDLMTSHRKEPSEVIEILDPEGKISGNQQEETKGQGKTRAKRKLKVYQHPETGEIVETRGGNQKTLKAWKDEHGSDVVEGWRTDEDAPQQQAQSASADPDDKPVASSKKKATA